MSIFFVPQVASATEVEQNLYNENNNLVESNANNELMNFNGIRFYPNIEQYDYMDVMPQSIAQTLYDWLIDLGFCESNQSHIQFVEQNKNKIIQKAISDGIIDNFLDINYNESTRWGGPTHAKLMGRTLLVLYGDSRLQGGNSYDDGYNLQATYNFFNDYYAENLDGNYTLLNLWHREPDYPSPSMGTTEFISGTHYYNVGATAVGGYYPNGNGNTSRSARTRFEEHYSTALSIAKYAQKFSVGGSSYTSYMQLAVRFFGRSLHYLSDAGNTAHSRAISSGSFFPITFSNAHKLYEDYVDANFDVFPVAQIYQQTNNLYDYYLNSDLGTIINDLATFSGSNSFYTIVYNKNQDDYSQVAIPTFSKTVQFLAVMMNRFYQDITNTANRDVHYIKVNQDYFIRNYSSDYTLTAPSSTNNSLITQRLFDGSSNQRFTTSLNAANGSFSLSPNNTTGKKLSFNSNKIGILSNTDTGSTTASLSHANSRSQQQLKFTHINSNYYRIMTFENEESTYYNFSGPMKPSNPYTSDSVTINAYNPTDYLYQWQFDEVYTLPSYNNAYPLGSYYYSPVCYLASGNKMKFIYNSDISCTFDIQTMGTNHSTLTCHYLTNPSSNLTYYCSSSSGGIGNNAKLSNIYLAAGTTYYFTVNFNASMNEYGEFVLNFLKLQ